MKILIPKKLVILVMGLLVITGISMINVKLAHADTTVNISITANAIPASAADWHVVSSPAGIDCTGGSGTCAFDFAKGIDVVLTATPPSDRLVSFWQVPTDCHGSSQVAEFQNSCTFTASQTENIQLYWVYATYTVSVATKGTGSGTITSSAGGLSCPSTCTHTYNGHDIITLTPTPAAGSTFAGWGAENEGSTTCWISGKYGGTVRSYSSTCLFGVAIADSIRTYTAAVAFFDKVATTTTTPPPSSSSAASAPPATTELTPPTITKVTVNGTDLTTQSTAPMSLPDNKTVTLSGQTVPNGAITLYIFSEPQTAKTTADKDGKWSYVVSGLKAGSHHVEYTVTDPATNATSARAQLLAFTVTAAKKTTAASLAPTKHADHHTLWIILGLAVIALAAIAGFAVWWFKLRDKRQPENHTPGQ